MKFFRSVDLTVPADFAWDRANDFTAMETRARAAGAAVARLDQGPPGPCSRWRVSGFWRGKERTAEVAILALEAPEMMHVAVTGQMFTVSSVIHFVMMTGRASRIEVTIEARANNLRGRIALRAAALARGRIGKRIAAALNRAARAIERDYYR